MMKHNSQTLVINLLFGIDVKLKINRRVRFERNFGQFMLKYWKYISTINIENAVH